MTNDNSRPVGPDVKSKPTSQSSIINPAGKDFENFLKAATPWRRSDEASSHNTGINRPRIMAWLYDGRET